jgi:spore maturation protein CgeB
MNIVILGLSVSSSWGNGHATTYRALIRGLASRGHRVLFLERDLPWYAANRDEPQPAGATTEIYRSFDDLLARFEEPVSRADLVMVGSFVHEGARVAEWVTAVARGVTAFYDIDTPVTLGAIASGKCEYVTPALIRQFGMYLSFTGGPTLGFIESRYGARMARALYCSVDPELYRPRRAAALWDLGYLGTFSADRQPVLERLMLRPAREWPEGRFAVVGPQYPEDMRWPVNVSREIHLSPRDHPAFYAAQRFTLNVTRQAMKDAGYSPSVRLFEAGACATPIISDWWSGLDSLFEPGTEILLASDAEDTLRFLKDIPDEKRIAIGRAARQRILREHTPRERAVQLESYWKEFHDNHSARATRGNRRRGKGVDGLETWLAPQRDREVTSGETGAAAEASADPGDIQQSAGARP